MVDGKVVVVIGKPYVVIESVMVDNSYSCDDCVASGDMGLCMALPECYSPYIHFVKE